MSNDYDDPQARDIVDEDVSRAYRDIATERAPASLNERVLRDARSHAKGGYSHAVRWLRPIAWAATVALSLAIVIQLTMLPGIEAPERVPAGIVPDSDTAGRLDDSAEEKLDRAVAPPAQAAESTAPAGGAGIGSSDAFAITDAPLLEQARDLAAEQTATEREAGAADVTTAQELRHAERRVPETAAEPGDAAVAGMAKEEMRGERSAPDDAAVSRAAAAASVDEAVAAGPAPEADARPRQMLRDSAFASTAAVEIPAGDESFCDETARRTPETWLECIEELRRDGRADDADAEQERLTETFPGFVIR